MSKSRQLSDAINSVDISESAPADAVTLDSSGNLLVGKTAISGTTVGFEARADGLVQTVRDSGLAMRLYRQTLDGDIVEFRKDNTPVGSIGTKGSDLYLGTGVVGLRFEDSSNSIVAIDTTTQGSTDADVDLGKSNVRFKDLYLSGGVTFDAGSNFLDDYEYGLHTPVLTNATTNLTYTIPQDKTYYVKIGRLIEVHYDFDINVTNVGSGQLQMSLPFTCQSSPQSFQTNYGMRASSFFPSLFGYEVTGFPSSNNYFFQKTTGAGGVEATLDHTDYTTGNKRISFIISYLTTA